MKKILFDLSATQPAEGVINHGGSEYAKAVFYRLVELFPKQIFVFYNPAFKLEDSIVSLIQKNSVECLLSVNETSILEFISLNNINTFYTALPTSAFKKIFALQNKTFEVIITIHGLRFLEMPFDDFEWYYCITYKSKLKFLYKKLFLTRYLSKLKKYLKNHLNAYTIITVSDHSKYSLLSFFPNCKRIR